MHNSPKRILIIVGSVAVLLFGGIALYVVRPILCAPMDDEFARLLNRTVDSMELRVVEERTGGLDLQQLPWTLRVCYRAKRVFPTKPEMRVGFPDRSDHYVISADNQRFECVAQVVQNRVYLIQVLAQESSRHSAERWLDAIASANPRLRIAFQIQN